MIMSAPQSHELYLALMKTARERLDAIDALKSWGTDFIKAESAAFHGRKIVEAIAFGCLIAVDNRFKTIPRAAAGHWNAAEILKSLKKKQLCALPSPSKIRTAEASERAEHGVTFVLEGLPERRLTHDELLGIYRELHPWLHEVNPYVHASQADFCEKHASDLWSNLEKLKLFIDKHAITIQGAGFFCVLHDNGDEQTKVIAITKPGVVP
jgi:hypothetical protein